MDRTETVTRARSFWVETPGLGSIREEQLAPPKPGEATVAARYGGISRGTETLVFRGDVPPSEYRRMRAPLQRGEFPGPVQYGYSVVGVVDSGPDEWVGRPVFCLHPHQDRFVVPLDLLHAIPERVPPARAILAANMETALNAAWDAALRPGDRVAVVGAGAVGCLVASLAARVPACRVTLVDLLEQRADVAARLGVRFATPGEAVRVAGGADIVFHTSGTPEGLATAIALGGFESTIVELSWYGLHPVSVGLGSAFHSLRLRLISSQVGHVSPARRARRDRRARMFTALELLDDRRLDSLISGEVPFEELPGAMARLAAGESALCPRVVYENV